MHILHTALNTYSEVLTRRICLTIKRFVVCVPYFAVLARHILDIDS